MAISGFQAVSFIIGFVAFFPLRYVEADCAGNLAAAGLSKLSTGLQPSYPQEM
jgi:hypothetical protein